MKKKIRPNDVCVYKDLGAKRMNKLKKEKKSLFQEVKDFVIKSKLSLIGELEMPVTAMRREENNFNRSNVSIKM